MRPTYSSSPSCSSDLILSPATPDLYSWQSLEVMLKETIVNQLFGLRDEVRPILFGLFAWFPTHIDDPSTPTSRYIIFTKDYWTTERLTNWLNAKITYFIGVNSAGIYFNHLTGMAIRSGTMG